MASILSDFQRGFLQSFFSSGPISSEFYLSGGTALAEYYLQHRYSDDLDLFTRNPARLADVRPHVLAALEKSNLLVRERREGDQMLQYWVEGDPRPHHPLRKVDVLLDTEPIFAEPEVRGGVRVDALLSIAINKVATVFSRGEPKDCVDLYFILTTKPFELEALLPLAAQKDLGFDELRFAAALAGVSRFQDLPRFLQDYMVAPLSSDELTRFCAQTASRIFDRYPPRR